MRRAISIVGDDWSGAIAFMLATGIAISMVIAITGTVATGRPLSQQSGNVLSTLFGASIGVIGTYLGAHGRHGARADDRRRRSTDPPSLDP